MRVASAETRRSTEAIIPRSILAIAAGSLALATAVASAGELSNENRGYGGPLYVGPNFNSSDSYKPQRPAPKPYTVERSSPKRVSKSQETHKATTSDETDTTETTPAKKPAEGEGSTASDPTASSELLKTETAGDGAKTGDVGCKKYSPEIGAAVSVPCE